MHLARSPLSITLSVWKALFLRESLGRLFASRGMAFWLVAEPVLHVSYLMFIFTVISVRSVGGIDTAIWIMVGMLAFFFFRRTGVQVAQGIKANQALFAYRQVKPVDTVLVRGLLEGFLLTVVVVILMAVAALLGHASLPADPVLVLAAFLGMWLIGMGFGLIGSVVNELLPEFERVVNLAMMPMYLISGVMFPIAAVQQPYRDWLLLNPIAHGLEAARVGFAPYYHAAPETSLAYVYAVALCMVFFGLALHRRFAARLSTQ
jgi:capsular polysaccharide transport system permease protein